MKAAPNVQRPSKASFSGFDHSEVERENDRWCTWNDRVLNEYQLLVNNRCRETRRERRLDWLDLLCTPINDVQLDLVLT